MNPPPQRPTTPKKELQIQGPRPSPLRLSKDSVKIKKPPPHPHLRQNPPQQQFQQHQEPVVIYTVSPKVIHTSVNEFMSLVQRLTGPSSSPPGDLSPAARLASIEKTSPSSDHKHFPPVNSTTTTFAIDDDDFMDSILEGIDLMGQFPGILSPAPATMPPIPAGFFSPAAEDPQNFNWQGANNINSGFNSFMPSPSSNSALFSAPLVSPSPSSWDLFNSFLGF
ncbi:protein MKS1 [Rosa rugosa]|uniref:protein MKS1 n=1 Tax=Rosa rugosa TaxID=74645 RepID=UPI002B40D688|nr:protein MKS1 [Rosa rugosa]